MTNLALVTGASSGIGTEFARYHASKGGDLIITARREAQLTALKDELENRHGIKVHVIALDLGKAKGADELYKAVRKIGEPVSILINNAGFGGHGDHIDRDLKQELAMIDLNIKSLVSLTHNIANDMVKNGGGKILNVGSTAGMMPGPKQAVYFATKAFVNSFSQAIDHELRPKGVTSTVLAPGYVHTEFAKAADLENTKLVAQKGATAASVAKHGYDAMMAGKLHTINEKQLSFMLNWVIPLMPRRMALKFMSDMQAKD